MVITWIHCNTVQAQSVSIPRNLYASSGKSASFPQDIRKKLMTLSTEGIELEQKGSRRYPTSDLIPVRKTLAQVLVADIPQPIFQKRGIMI
jgi:hypothetical protein